jgi:hypothetical protein
MPALPRQPGQFTTAVLDTFDSTRFRPSLFAQYNAVSDALSSDIADSALFGTIVATPILIV